MNIEHLILCIYPAILLTIMLVKVKVSPKGTVHEDFLSLEQSKILQGIAAVSIVLHHLTQYITEYGNVWKGPITVYSSMGILFTTIFFFCSGFGLVTSYKKKPDYLKTFFRKRIPTVLIPFMLSNIIYLIFVGVYFRRIGSMLEGIGSFFGLILINTNTWFLVEILILYLAFYFIFRFIKKPNHAMAAMAVFIILLITGSLLLGHDYSESGGHWFMGEWWYNTTIFFFVGMLMAQYYESILAFFKKQYKWLLPVSVVAFLVMFYVEELILKNFGYYQEWEGHPGYGAKAITLLAQIMVCSVWLLMILLINLKVKFNNKLLVLLSKISLELYIIHDIFKVHFTISRHGREDWVVFLWVLILSLGAAIALQLVNRFLIRLTTEHKKRDEDEVLTLEQKVKRKQQKKRNIIIIACSVIVITTVSVIAAKELYELFILPEKQYEEEVMLLSDAEVGDEIVFGTFGMGGTFFEKERITWIVIDKKDDKVLLLSKYVVASKEFHNSYVETTWENSNLRLLLNDVFYEEAFSKYEKELIVETLIETPDNIEFGTDGGGETTDKIFILSAEEVEMYFEDKSESTSAAAPYLEEGEVNVDAMNGINFAQRDLNSWWWLRTMGETPKRTAVVNTDGEIDLKGKHITTGSGGVRPAMWVVCE